MRTPGRTMLVVAVLVATAATGHAAFGAGGGPRAHAACAAAPGVLCQESGNVSLPPNSTAAESTDVVPPKATEADTFLQPFNAAELADFDSSWGTVVDTFPSFGNVKSVFVKRVITCSVFARASASLLLSAYQQQPGAEGEVNAENRYAAYLAVCLRAVLGGQRDSTQAARDRAGAAAGSPGCGLVAVSVPFVVRRVGRGYQAQLTGRITRARGRTPLSISCRARGSGIVLRQRAPNRGGLGRVIGQHLTVGFSNPTRRSVGIRATFSFK